MSEYINFEIARKYLHEACSGLGSNGGLMLKIKFDQEPTADVIEADNVQKTVETYCTDHCYHNAHCMEMYKDVDDAVEYLERKCEKCPLRELRDLDMRGEEE